MVLKSIHFCIWSLTQVIRSYFISDASLSQICVSPAAFVEADSLTSSDTSFFKDVAMVEWDLPDWQITITDFLFHSIWSLLPLFPGQSLDVDTYWAALVVSFVCLVATVNKTGWGWSTNENDAAQRCSKHKMHEAAASMTEHTLWQQTFFSQSREYTLK